MPLTAERARTLAIYDKYAPLLCETCEVGAPTAHGLFGHAWSHLCVDCQIAMVAPYPLWTYREGDVWQEWTIQDVGELPDYSWEVWIEEARL